MCVGVSENHSLMPRSESGDMEVTAFQRTPLPWPLASLTHTYPLCAPLVLWQSCPNKVAGFGDEMGVVTVQSESLEF